MWVTCPRTRPARLRSRDAAFTVVEVVIAVLILSIVVSGITLASAGGSKLRGAAKLQSAMTAAGLKAQEDIVTDRSWMDRPECRSLGSSCDVTPVVRTDSLELDGISTKGLASTSMQVLKATSQAIDSPVDKQGDQDADGVVPDFYRIELQLTVPQTVASRYSSTSATLTRTLTTTIDRRGKEQEGSLAVEVCRVVNQSDERMAIQGCAETGSSAVKVDGCPPVPRPGCVPAFGWIAGKAQSDTAPSPFVVMHRVATGISFTVQNTTTGQTWSSGSATKDKGLFVFQNLPAGAYKINGLPDSIGGGTERWDSKEVPQFHGSPGQPITGDSSAVVEPGLRNRALVLFRPLPAGSINLYFDRTVKDYYLGGPMQSGGEYVVPDGTPTSAYLGGSATEFCALYNLLGLVTCTLGSTAPNCMTAYATGFDYIPVASGGDFNVDNTGIYPALDGNGTLRKYTFSNRPYGEFCTTYSELHTYTYYARTGGITSRILPGAVAGAGYNILSAPDNRVIDVTGGTATAPMASCIVPKRGQCSGFKPLQAGLNTSMIITPSDTANAAANANVIALPTWLNSGGIWVQPGGLIQTPAGTVGTNPTAKARGVGECYWRSSRYGGAQEGPCDPCSPVFDPGVTFIGACSILTNDAVVRIVTEHTKRYSLLTGAIDQSADLVIATDGYDIPFSPPWACGSSVPSLLNRTCRRTYLGGGAITNRAGTYPSPTTGGNAIVNSSPISEGAA